MATYLFTWNPKNYVWDDYADWAADVTSGTAATARWSCGNSRSIAPGDRFYLLRQGIEPRGIVGSGVVVSECYEGEHYNDPNKTAFYNDIEFDALLDVATQPILERDGLLDLKPIGYWGVASSGIAITADIDDELAERWQAILNSLGIVSAASEANGGNSGGTGTSGSGTALADTSDDRLKALALITLRPGQSAFRQKLRERYGDGCQVSGCPIMSIVQACHLDRVADNGSDHPDNGVLLRVDLHVLFDADLIGIDPNSLTVHVHHSLAETDYADLQGVELRFGERSPNAFALARRWAAFKARH